MIDTLHMKLACCTRSNDSSAQVWWPFGTAYLYSPLTEL